VLASLKAPNHSGSRIQATELTRHLPSDLSRQAVLIDCSEMQVSAPSFLDELVRELLVLRRARRLKVVGASERQQLLLRRAAENRSVAHRLDVEDTLPSPQ
jgi:hypothetical protein